MYYLLYSFFYVISLLPFWILYFLSDVVYVIIYYVISYRKKVVLSNLAIAFPEKTDAERKLIAKKFYKNFVDNFIEVIKLISLSEKQLQKRFTWNFESVNKYFDSGRNVQLHLGHFFNWEYADLALSLGSKFLTLVVYMPIANKAMDKIFIKLRSRFKAKMIAATNYLRDFRQYSKERFCLVFVADQNAGHAEGAYWLPLFNKRVPFVTGAEKSAKLNNTVCLYVKFIKLKRGYYHVDFFEITDTPRTLPEGEITKRMINFIEENIKEQPSLYLWSHRRWRHTFNPEKHRAL